MSNSADSLRAELAEHRDALANLQHREAAISSKIEELEKLLAPFRAKREEVQSDMVTERQAIEALEGALAFLAERMPSTSLRRPARTEPRVEEKSAEPPPARKPSGGGGRFVAREIETAAEELDLANVSQRTVQRASSVRAVLLKADGPMDQEEIARLLFEGQREFFRTMEKARSGSRVGLALLKAEERVRCVSWAAGTWVLTAQEKASANLGARLADFRGRTTSWPGEAKRSPAPGTRIVVEEGSYETGKR